MWQALPAPRQVCCQYAPPSCTDTPYARPSHLPRDGKLNVGFIGPISAGKSTLLNTLTGQLPPPGGHGAAVGVRQTTMVATFYNMVNCPGAIIWDLPGVGTVQWPAKTYCQRTGLRHYDLVHVFFSPSFLQFY